MFKRIICIVTIFSMIMISGCTDTNKENEKDLSTEIISKEHNGINISVDPRIELIGIVMYLSDNARNDLGYINDDESMEYIKNVDNHFLKFKNHEAVQKYTSIMDYGYAYDAPPHSMLYLNNPPNIKNSLDKYKKDLEAIYLRAGGKEEFDGFIEDLSSFATESNFSEFYNDNIDYYNKIIDDTINRVGDLNFIDEIESYYGESNDSYNIILNSLVKGGNFGPSVDKNLYSIVGVLDMKNGMPIFEDGYNFKYISRHEFSHSFVNLLTSKNIEEVNKYKNLMNPIADKMSSMAYTTWETCVNEHIVRAVVIRITEIVEGEESAQQLLNWEKECGFIYIEQIIEVLKEYENNRDKYKSFEEIYPQIIEVFKSI